MDLIQIVKIKAGFLNINISYETDSSKVDANKNFNFWLTQIWKNNFSKNTKNLNFIKNGFIFFYVDIIVNIFYKKR